MNVIDTQQQLEAIQYRAKKRDELGYAPNDIDFLLTMLDQADTCIKELEAQLKLEKHQHVGTKSACQTNGQLCDQWKADYENLQSRIEELEVELRRKTIAHGAHLIEKNVQLKRKVETALKLADEAEGCIWLVTEMNGYGVDADELRALLEDEDG